MPERWTKPEEVPNEQKSNWHFSEDKLDAVQPFLQGPRDCIGQNLARLELHLILGRMLYSFNLSAASKDAEHFVWENQSTFTVWDRSPLPVHLELA